jgi:hypothetical protein
VSSNSSSVSLSSDDVVSPKRGETIFSNFSMPCLFSVSLFAETACLADAGSSSSIKISHKDFPTFNFIQYIYLICIRFVSFFLIKLN